MTRNERWRPVANFEGSYEVSYHGRVRNAKGAILSLHANNNVYRVVYLHSAGRVRQRRFLLHRLVAQAFVKNRFNKPEVNHKDGDKTNCYYKNSEWATRLENVAHGYRAGLTKHDHQRVTVTGRPVTGGAEITFASQVDAEMQLAGKVTGAIGHAIRRDGGSAYGHYWRKRESI